MYHSETYGDLDLIGVKGHISAFMKVHKNNRYQVIIGTDSQKKSGGTTDFVTAIIVHRMGHGGIYFWKRIVDDKKRVLKQRILEEASMSFATPPQIFWIF